jgi:RNA polymerase sporulation-specific sigma factor
MRPFVEFISVKVTNKAYGAAGVPAESVSFDDAVEICGDDVKAMARRYGNSESDPEDLFQEGLIALERACRTYDGSSRASFRTYAMKCVRNAMLDVVSRQSAKKAIPRNMLTELDDESGEGWLQDSSADSGIDLSGILNGLSDLEKKTIGLYIAGYKPREIAEMTGRPVKSVENALSRARSKIQSNMPR